MFERNQALLFLAAPALLCAQVLKPPPQEYVLHFQGNAVASTDQISLGATFTMEAWVFLEASSPTGVIMGKANDPRGSDPFVHYTLGLNGLNGLKPAFAQSTGQPGTYRNISGSSDLPLYSWTHMAAVLDAGVMRLYVNGQQVASGPSPGPPGGSAVPFGLGGGIPDGKSLCCPLPGALREARVWSRALSASELQTVATQKLTGNEPGLIANWPFSEGSGQVVHGIGPQAATLTIQDGQGAVTWAHTKLLDNGPYWELQDLPSLLPNVNGRGVQPSVFLNADHRPDILLAYTPYASDAPTPGPVLFLHNEGNRVFTPVNPVQPAMMIWPDSDAVADFDGDGYQDVVIAEHGMDRPPWPGGITRIFMQRSGEMKDETEFRLPPGTALTEDVCSADVNRDGSPDLFFSNIVPTFGDRKPSLYLNDGKGHFRTANELLPSVFLAASPPTLPTFESCLFVDVNRDGAPDLLLGAWTGNPQIRDTLLLNDGQGILRDVSSQSIPLKRGGSTWQTVGFAAPDVNRDGWPDLIIVMSDPDYSHGTMQLLINNRDGTFHEQEDAALNSVSADGLFFKPYAIDINQDGWPDLVVNQPGGVRLYQNVGGHFEDRSETLQARRRLQARAVDFDGDGRIDIALINGNSTKIAWGKNLWPPAATSNPVVTSANMAGGFPGIVQNGWIEIKGTNLTAENVGPGGMTWDGAREFAAGGMPESIGGASATINGKPAFVFYVSPTQLNVLTPIDSALGTVQIVVTSGGLSSLPFSANMVAAAPSFALYGSPQYLVSQHSADYSLVGPVSLSAPGYPVTPAKPGETIVVYAFGFGLPTTSLVNGSVTQSGVLPVSPVIQIGGLPAAVKFAGVISPGLYMFNVVVPSTAPDGDNLVTCTYNGSTAPTGGLVAVRR